MTHALELKSRLPRLHAQVRSGRVPVWRARKVAEQTIGLSPEAAAFIDAQVAAFAHTVGPAALDRLVAEAVARFMPEQAEADALAAAESRHMTFDHHQVSFNGTTHLEAELDLADALDLDAAITQGAATLAAAGCAESLDVRRAMAAGELARRQLTLDLADTVATPRPGPKPRQVVLYQHLSEEALRGCRRGVDVARVENHQRLVTAEQVKTWCATPGAQVVVKPVLDLDEHIHVESYEVPDRLAEQTDLVNVTCAFPWCARPARGCKKDHVIPHARGGPTATGNIAPLCKRHHRLKTHASGWSYTVIGPGAYLWSSPHGYTFLRDQSGTRDVSREAVRGQPAPDD